MKKFNKYISSLMIIASLFGVNPNATKGQNNLVNSSTETNECDSTDTKEEEYEKGIPKKYKIVQKVIQDDYDDDDDLLDKVEITYKKFLRKHPNVKLAKNFIIGLSAYKFLSGCFHSKLADYGFSKRFSDISDVSTYEERVKAFLREAFIFSRDYRFTSLLNPADWASLSAWLYGDVCTLSGIKSQAISSASRMEILKHGACIQAALAMKYWMDRLRIHNFLAIYEGHYFVIFNATENCYGPWQKIELTPSFAKRLGIDEKTLESNGIHTNKWIDEQSKVDDNGHPLGFFDRKKKESKLKNEKSAAYEKFAQIITPEMIPKLSAPDLDLGKIYIISDDKRVLPYEIFEKVNPKYLKTAFKENGVNLISYFIGIKSSKPKSEYLKSNQ